MGKLRHKARGAASAQVNHREKAPKKQIHLETSSGTLIWPNETKPAPVSQSGIVDGCCVNGAELLTLERRR